MPTLIFLGLNLLAVVVVAFVLRDYWRSRFDGTEDRYMSLYGEEAWEGSNMDLYLRFDPAVDAEMKQAFFERLDAHLEKEPRLHEEFGTKDGELTFVESPVARARDLVTPRRGIYLEAETPGEIKVVWNHMQMDGVGIWEILKPLFDPNEDLLTYTDVPTPPPVIPEVLGVPRLLSRLSWSGSLERPKDPAGPLHEKFTLMPTEFVRALKDRLGTPFNLTSSAVILDALFQRHPEAGHLTAGLTVYYPFMKGRNKYGVFPVRVERAGIAEILEQLERHVSKPMLNWGVSSTFSYILSKAPDQAFLSMMGQARAMFDVMISNLPVGKHPSLMAGSHVTMACHSWELTLPYYFLLIGTRHNLHISTTSHFEIPPDFLSQARVEKLAQG